MLSKEEFSTLVTSIKDKLDETTQALVSEELLSVLSSYGLALDEMASRDEKITKLTADNEDLLKVNGRLFQKIGFEKEKTEEEIPEEKEEEIKIDDIINEKGELI